MYVIQTQEFSGNGKFLDPIVQTNEVGRTGNLAQ